MSWDCPHWNNEICELNGMPCKPGKGYCILRNRYVIISGNEEKNKNRKDNPSSVKNDKHS